MRRILPDIILHAHNHAIKFYSLIFQQREIDAILSGQLTADEEEDVLKELDELIVSEKDITSIEFNDKIPELPNVPTDRLPSPSKVGTRQKEEKAQSSRQKVALEAT